MLISSLPSFASSSCSCLSFVSFSLTQFDYLARDSLNLGMASNFKFQRLISSTRVIDNEICYNSKEGERRQETTMNDVEADDDRDSNVRDEDGTQRLTMNDTFVIPSTMSDTSLLSSFVLYDCISFVPPQCTTCTSSSTLVIRCTRPSTLTACRRRSSS